MPVADARVSDRLIVEQVRGLQAAGPSEFAAVPSNSHAYSVSTILQPEGRAPTPVALVTHSGDDKMCLR